MMFADALTDAFPQMDDTVFQPSGFVGPRLICRRILRAFALLLFWSVFT